MQVELPCWGQTPRLGICCSTGEHATMAPASVYKVLNQPQMLLLGAVYAHILLQCSVSTTTRMGGQVHVVWSLHLLPGLIPSIWFGR